MFPIKGRPIKWAFVLAFAAALLTTAAVFAEEAPPETPQPEAPVPSEVEAPVLSEVEAPVPSEVEAPVPSEVEAPVPSEVEAPVPSEVEAAAESVPLVVLDEHGEAMDMASSASAETLMLADPYYTSGGIRYSFSTIQAAINDMVANNRLPDDGFLYVEDGTYSSFSVYALTDDILQRLKGVKSEHGSTTTFIVDTTPVIIAGTLGGFTLSGFDINLNAGMPGALIFHDNTGTLTLNDVKVRNSSGRGILITNHTGAVKFSHVIASDNKEMGAHISNTAAVYPVTIEYSEFDHNQDGAGGVTNYGLWISTKGAVTLNNVSASHNDGRGAYIASEKTVTVKNSAFNANYSNGIDANLVTGLQIESTYPTNHVVLNNVNADGNSGHGIQIDTQGNLSAVNVNACDNGKRGFYFRSTSSASITSGTFMNNQTGLELYPLKAVTLKNIIANNNSDRGVYLNNCQESGGVCLGSGAVLITGTTPNQFSSNGGTGLSINASGAVTLTNFIASYNGQNGVSINNNYSGITAGVTVNASYVPSMGTFVNQVCSNGSSGLSVRTYGAISVDKVLAEKNSVVSILLQNHNAATAKNVLVKNSEARGTINSGIGINIRSKGIVTVKNCSAHHNTSYGLYINNTDGTGSVLVSATTLKDFSGNTDVPIYIWSKGTVTVDHVNAQNSISGTWISNKAASAPRSVLVRDSNFSSASSVDGLYIESRGTVTLRRVTANDCFRYGLYINNKNLTSPQAVVLSRVTVSKNQAYGIQLYSHGNVSANNVNVSNNSTGMFIDNCDKSGSACQGTGSVSIGGTWNVFNDNGTIGLRIYSGGAINLSNIEMLRNLNTGLLARNDFENESVGITLSAAKGKYNNLSLNQYSGLDLKSYGVISINRTHAEDNFKFGARIDNSNAAFPKNVLITDSYFNHNQGGGLYLLSRGIVTLKGVNASGNARYNSSVGDVITVRDSLSREKYEYAPGRWESWWWSVGGNLNILLHSEEFKPRVYLYNEADELIAFDGNLGATADASVSVPGLPAGNYRIEVAAKYDGFGVYDLAINESYTGYDSSYLDQIGMQIYNTFGSGDVFVLPLGSKGSVFNYNALFGLVVNSQGNIMVSKARADYNFSTGLILDNDAAPTAKKVTLLNSGGNYNGTGVEVQSAGAIQYTGGSSSFNIEGGAVLVNAGASSPQAVTISNAAFDTNKNSNGLTVYSLGNITLTNVSACGNSGPSSYGLLLDNCLFGGGVCTGTGKISVTGRYLGRGADENTFNGMELDSSGSISIKNYQALKNGNIGAYIYNAYTGLASPVSVSGSASAPSNFSDNLGHDGLEIFSHGNISVSYVTAHRNINNGVSAFNNYAGASGTITLIRVYANGNNSDGVVVDSRGSVTGSYLQANENMRGGFSIGNQFATGAQPINLTCVEANGNVSQYGFKISSTGRVTLNRASGNDNGKQGLWVNTDGDLSLLATLGANSFSRNNYAGILIEKAINVNLDKVTADWNGDQGIRVQGATTLIINSSSFSHNAQIGISANLSGNFTLNKLMVLNNGGPASDFDGINIITPVGTSGQILNSIISGHYGEGIDVAGPNTLTLLGTFYYGNDMDFDQNGRDLYWH